MCKTAKGHHFSVGKTNGEGVFREIRTGEFVGHVMSKRVFDKATEHADKKIRDYLKGDRARKSA